MSRLPEAPLQQLLRDKVGSVGLGTQQVKASNGWLPAG